VFASRWLLDDSEDHIASIFVAGRHSVGSHSFVDPFLHVSVFGLTMAFFPSRGLVTLQGAVSYSVQWNLL